MELRFSRIAVLLPGALLLTGCLPPNPALHPSISVAVGQNVLVIKGTGFSATENLCAHLTLGGGPVGFRPIGDPSCSGGAFADIPYPYAYGGCNQTNSTATITVFAQDPSSSAGASQTIQIPWGPNCSMQAAGCLNSGASCIACGGEGQPVCSNGGCVEPSADGQPVCSANGINAGCVATPCDFQAQRIGTCTVSYPDLHPTLAGNQLVCTANCGHTQGYKPCYPYMDGCNANPGTTYPSTIIGPERACKTTTQSGLPAWSCYDNALLSKEGECSCVPSQGTCPVSSSPGDGTCRPAQLCSVKGHLYVAGHSRADAVDADFRSLITNNDANVPKPEGNNR
jgi:hypothetical protein